MNSILKILSFLLLTVVILSSCEERKYPDFNKTESGLYYKFHTDIDGDKPKEGEILSFHVIYGSKDSIIMNSYDFIPEPMPVEIQLLEPMYPGDINEGFAMMSKGDSASFIIDADSFFNYTAQQPLPDFIEPGSNLYFDIKLVDIMSEQEYVKKQEELAEKFMKESEELAEKEEESLNNYLQEHNISVEPKESGLIYVEKLKGSGPAVEPGNKVKVIYEGRLLDGNVFDDSGDSPIEVTVGKGQLIRGWDEGLPLMNKGGKAKLIIPSYLAYGDRGVPNAIPPFSALVFDIEIVEVIK